MIDAHPSEAWFQLVVEAAPNAMLLVDGDRRIRLVNRGAEALFGYDRSELIGRAVEVLLPARFADRHAAHVQGYQERPSARVMGTGRDLYGLRKDGTEVPIEIGLSPVETPAGRFTVASIVDITERTTLRERFRDAQEATARLNRELEARVVARTDELLELNRLLGERSAQKEVLLQEVHHRVKNNLQVIASLISMQARHVADDSARAALAECRARVESIALIHETLYQSKDYARIPFSDYARTLATSIFRAAEPAGVALALDIEALALPVDAAIPCGLILNELISNALKHAFPGGRPGTVRVSLRRTPAGEAALAVADDGVGLGPEVAARPSPSLGLHLVAALVRQIDGRLEVSRDGGARFCVSFPLPEPP